MSEPQTLQDLIGTGPLPAVESRQCRLCLGTKPFQAPEWVTHGAGPNRKAVGHVCKKCDNDRSSRKTRKVKASMAAGNRDELKRRMKAEAAGLPVNPQQPPKTIEGVQAQVRRQLSITSALRAGADAVNANAVGVLALVMQYALDPSSPHHEWAAKMVADRIMPAKLYADLGLAAAGQSGVKGGPSIQINVLPAAPGAQAVPAAITVRAIESEDESGESAEVAAVPGRDGSGVGHGAAAAAAGRSIPGAGEA